MANVLRLFRSAEPQAPAPAQGVDMQPLVAELGRRASELGREAAEVRGLLDDSKKVLGRQADALGGLENQVQEVNESQDAIGSLTRGSMSAVARVREAVAGIGGEVMAVVDTLAEVSQAAGQITQIALQTRLVAFNASVEAKRAGRSGEASA